MTSQPFIANLIDLEAASERATLTIKETASVLGVDERTVSRAIHEGDIQTMPVGRRILVLRLPLLARLKGEVAA